MKEQIELITIMVEEMLRNDSIPEQLWPVILSNVTEQMRLRISVKVINDASIQNKINA